MKILKMIALPLLMLPLIGSTCTKATLVTLAIDFPTIAEFVASGELNTHEDTQIVDVKSDIDIAGTLADYGIDPMTLEDDAVKVIDIAYRIIKPDPEGTREIVNGELEIVELSPADSSEVGAPIVAATGFTAQAGAATDWIDITPEFTQAGIDEFNDFLVACLRNLKGLEPAPPGLYRYTVRGDSNPGDVLTDFVWQIRVRFQGTFEKEYDVFGGA